MIDQRRQGKTFQAIADDLMADGITTSRGKAQWYPATVKAVTESDNAVMLMRSRVDG
ncbi:MAG: recombinase family protein [Mycobacterium sp.]|uniref:recombinase family protein n=1 Tax=Mycobacterium sp. TaxID=1785 RepID=UPI003F97F076